MINGHHNSGMFSNTAKAPKPFDLKATLLRCLYHWPLFLICLAIAAASIFFYMLHAKPTYIVNAKLVVKDNGNKTNEEIALKELNQTEKLKGIQTEIEIIRSKPLITKVVNDLQLWVTYEHEGKYVMRDLYQATPVHFKLLSDPSLLTGQVLEIVIDDARHYHISNNKTPKRTAFGSVLEGQMGTWQLEPTNNIKYFIGKTIKITVTNQADAVSKYQGTIKIVNTDKEVPIIDMSIEDDVPERGLQVINALIDEYYKASVLAKQRASKSTLNFIDSSLTSLTLDLNGVEKNVESFKSARGLTDITSNSQLSLANFQTSDNQVDDIDLKLGVINDVEKYIKTEANSETPPSTIGINDPNLSQLVTQLGALEIERNKLLANTPEKNPIFLPLNKQIAATKDAIKNNVAGIKASLLSMKKQLVKNNTKFESSIKNVPGQERQLGSIKRQQGTKETLYGYLLQKREEVALAYATIVPDASTIEKANVNGAKSSKTNLVIALSIVMGLMAPIGLIYGRDAINSLIVDQADITGHTNTPVLLEIMNDENCSLELVLNKSRYIIGEQFRDLRTRLHFLHAKKEGRVTLITSSISGEGKSFVAAKLAVTLAASGRKTILLDLDMRIPKLHKILNLDEDKKNLIDFLSNNARIEDIVQQTPLHNKLFSVVMGTPPQNPSELLESAGIRRLIEVLKQEFDDVLIDSPPLHLVTDALIIAELCDVTLYVVRQGYTPKSELTFIDRTFNENKLPNMNIIFNGVEKIGKYSYGYKVNKGYYVDAAKTSSKLTWKGVISRF
jgi:capsular exopolysaccharide synthesis family protein